MLGVLLREVVKTDPILKHLLENSSLTPTQLDTLLIHLYSRGKGMRLEDMVRMRDGGVVSEGAFLTTLKQARKNLSKSLYTLLLASYLGVLDEELWSGLARVGGLLTRIRDAGPSRDDVRRVVELVGSVVARVLKL